MNTQAPTTNKNPSDTATAESFLLLHGHKKSQLFITYHSSYPQLHWEI